MLSSPAGTPNSHPLLVFFLGGGGILSIEVGQTDPVFDVQ